MKTKIILLIVGIFLFTGCVKNVSRDFVKDKSHSLEEVFEKMLYKNDNYPFIYQKYLTFRGDSDAWYDETVDFDNKIELLCNTRGGEIMSIFDFDSKYKINKEDMMDRCFRQDFNKICVMRNKNNDVPKVLFLTYSGSKQSDRMYVKRWYHKSGNYAYFDGVPDQLGFRKYNQVEEKVCIPDQENWDFYFKSAQRAYLVKTEEEKIKKAKKIKKQEEEKLKNSFRRF